jgi:hypothetical protein
MKRPLSLTDNQLRLIEHAAASLPVDARDVPVFMCDAKPKEKTP